MTLKIGILNSDFVRPELAGTFGEYPHMFSELLKNPDPSVEFISYDVILGVYPDNIDDVDAYLITGSKFSVYDNEDWIRRLGSFVVELNDRKKKLLAICFGHQMVAHFLGGKTAKSDVGWTVGVHSCLMMEDVFGNNCDGQVLNFLASHQDQVIELADGARTIASNENCPHVMTRIGDHILTLQWHPEFTKDYLEKLLHIRRDLLGDELFLPALDSLSMPIDNDQFSHWAIDFMRG